MTSTASNAHRRILIIDDNRAIHDDFRKILGEPSEADKALLAAEARLFGAREAVWFEIDSASQGQEGLDMVERAMAEERPYSMAFVDVRMPPGMDGVETTRRIWEVSPDLQIVICTAFSDCSWNEMQDQINPMDRLLILKKPFDTIEVLQLANTLTEKWRLLQESKSQLGKLDQMVKQRTEELEQSRREALVVMEEAVTNRQQVERAYEELTRETQERRKLEKQHREQASLLDKARDAIIVRDLDHHITYWNKSAERIYGRPAAEALGRSLADLVYPDPIEFFHATEQVLQRGDWVGELRQAGKTGQSLIIEGRWTLVRDENGEPQSILEIDTDITQQKKLEQQYLRAQRLESIGTLAGGIAHDLNNVLAPIVMSIDLLKHAIPDQRGQEVLAIIAGSAKRGADLISQVLTFARGKEGRRNEVSPQSLVNDIERIIGDTFPKAIAIRTEICPGLWTLLGDSTQLHQVLLNLCVNSRDAMPDGGRITIKAENLTLDQHFATMNLGARAGRYVLLEVEDTGSGIPHAIIDNIFDPFFTTKEVGQGTGLGLSTCQAIVKGHGGFIRVFSELGIGTRIQVYIPAQAEAGGLSPEPCDAGEPELPRGNGETVLVVDDEEPIRQITRQTLEACGYRVLLAGDGQQAVNLYSRHQQQIDVVLTDMMMPVMDGASTIRSLLKLNPGLVSIAASGITTGEYVKKAMQTGVKLFLPKPYTAATLSKALRQVLVSEDDPCLAA